MGKQTKNRNNLYMKIEFQNEILYLPRYPSDIGELTDLTRERFCIPGALQINFIFKKETEEEHLIDSTDALQELTQSLRSDN